MNVADFLTERKVQFDLIPHRETHDAPRMAATIHIPGRQVAKTTLLRTSDGTFVVAILPANSAVDFEQASQMLGGGEVELATEVDISRQCADCEIGALPPFGSQYGMKTMVDECIAENDEIVFEGNTHHEAIRMNFEDFREIEQPLIGSFVRIA